MSKKTSSNEREGLQELIVVAADWLDSVDFEIPIGFKSNSLYTQEVDERNKITEVSDEREGL